MTRRSPGTPGVEGHLPSGQRSPARALTLPAAYSLSIRLRDGVAIGLLAVTTGLISAQYRLGWDEAAWLAVGRRMDLGDRLFRDVIENKPPVVYLLVRLSDMMPGSFEAARAALLGALVFALALLSIRVARRLGGSRRRTLWMGFLVAVLAVLQAGFLLTVEVIALVLIVAALWLLARDRPEAAGLLLSIAAMTDLRVPFLLPAIALFTWQMGGTTQVRRLALFTSPIAAFWVAVLIGPDLRFALVDLNLASRRGASVTLTYVADTARSLLPLLAGLFLISGGRFPIRGGPFELSTGALAISGILVAFASRQSYDHYWAFVLVAFPIAAAIPHNEDKPRSAASIIVGVGALVLALLPVFLVRGNGIRDQRDSLRRYEAVARVVKQVLGASGTFVQFDQHPFLPALLPSHFAARSPVLGFVTIPSERGRRELELLSATTARASLIVDDGSIDAFRTAVSSEYLGLWGMFRNHVADFPCRTHFEGLTLRARQHLCADLERASGT